jgi:hypothetical protein
MGGSESDRLLSAQSETVSASSWMLGTTTDAGLVDQLANWSLGCGSTPEAAATVVLLLFDHLDAVGRRCREWCCPHIPTARRCCDSASALTEALTNRWLGLGSWLRPPGLPSLGDNGTAAFCPVVDATASRASYLTVNFLIAGLRSSPPRLTPVTMKM